MEKWIKIFEIGGYQFAVMKKHDDENDNPLLCFVTFKDGIELSFNLGFLTPEIRDQKFDAEDDELISTCQSVITAFDEIAES
ncbi:hypothetical protein P1X15_10075 [Runella sp. MFBS21]|uniref:hypothetical protein n=1 Tax=Runella sp. MFBS21 TaxID=3034018 RepID=UPI0023F6EBF3|nr:hypothetical protein [Runella sp. MFBS21]MDF7817945.1 hypothetical protein [Runella sp. MFBS21]